MTENKLVLTTNKSNHVSKVELNGVQIFPKSVNIYHAVGECSVTLEFYGAHIDQAGVKVDNMQVDTVFIIPAE